MTRDRGFRGRPHAGGVLLVAAALVAACGAPRVRPVAATWPGPPPAVPADAQGPYFAPSPPLQFLVDPYPATEGPSWLGADVATSIRVDDDRYVWIFGDTLLGSVSARCPGGATYCDRRVDRAYEMIRNSVGIAERAEDGSFRRVVKHWPSDGGDPDSFFASGREGEFLWPLSGVRAGPALFVAANRHTPESGLAPVGNTMVRVANPDDDPEEWTITRHELPNFRSGSGPGPALVWTMAMAHIGPHVYLFGQVGSAFDARTVLARFAVEDMNAPEWTPAPEYLLRDARGDLAWSSSLDVDRLYRLRGLPGTSETTVLHDPEVGWYSYQLEPLGFDIRLYTAPDLEGPWRDSGVVYRVPPPWSTTRTTSCPPTETRCLAYIVYAVKAHPELAPADGRALSYNVNLGSGSLREAEDAAERVPGFYVPRMIVGPARPGAATLRRAVTTKPSGRRTPARAR